MSKLRPTGFRLVQNKTKNGWHIRYPNSERVFKISKKSRIGSRYQDAGPSIKDVRDAAKKDGLSKAETVTALKRLGFTQAEIDESYGVKEVKSPSPAKILGKPKDKKVTVNERTALRDQIKLQAQSSRKSVKAYKDAQKSLIDSINDMSRTGVITNAQSKSMIKKVLATNMLNDKLVDRLIDYIEKVYDNADYVDKVSKANKKRKTALKNLRGKVGPDTGLQSVLNELFTLNAKVIPVNKLDSYLKLVEEFGQRKTVLKDLRETGRVIDQAADIINSVTQEPIDSDDSFVVSEKNTLEELEQALTEATEDVDKEMIKKLIEFKKEQNKEIEENFNRLVKDIRSNNIELGKVIKLKDAIDLARELNNLTKEDIEALVKTKNGVSDYTIVENLEVVKDNMNNGS
jgi:DNA-binding transcriptional MerR regulator